MRDRLGNEKTVLFEEDALFFLTQAVAEATRELESSFYKS